MTLFRMFVLLVVLKKLLWPMFSHGVYSYHNDKIIRIMS